MSSPPVVTIVGCVAIAAGIAWAGSQGGAAALGVPVFALCAALSFALNWAVFVPSYVARTERYYDLTGSLTYLSLLAGGLLLTGRLDARAIVLTALVSVWAVRLGLFLFLRIRREGRDARFDRLKTEPLRFLTAWTLQALWVLLTLSCALAALTSLERVPLGALDLVGAGVWLAGFCLEVVADRQKQSFRAERRNRGRFIASGLWAWSRHPNYFGEIVLWAGVALIAFSALRGWQHVTLISPLFVYVLLTRISGIPLLEARAAKQWGDDPAYEAYVSRTPVLLPKPPTSR